MLCAEHGAITAPICTWERKTQARTRPASAKSCNDLLSRPTLLRPASGPGSTPNAAAPSLLAIFSVEASNPKANIKLKFEFKIQTESKLHHGTIVPYNRYTILWEYAAGPFPSVKEAMAASHTVTCEANPEGRWKWNTKDAGGCKQHKRCNMHEDCPVLLRAHALGPVVIRHSFYVAPALSTYVCFYPRKYMPICGRPYIYPYIYLIYLVQIYKISSRICIYVPISRSSVRNSCTFEVPVA